MKPALTWIAPGQPYYEIAAALISTLAYPNDGAAHRRYGGALLCAAIEGMMKAKTDSPSTAMQLLFEIRDRKSVATEIKKGNDIIARERRIATMAFTPKILAMICDAFGNPRSNNIPAPSSTEMLNKLRPEVAKARSNRGRKAYDRGSIEKSNFEKRVLKLSKPVIHLFWSFDFILKSRADFHGLDGASIGDLLLDESLAFDIVELAEKIRPAIAAAIGIAESEQARVFLGIQQENGIYLQMESMTSKNTTELTV
jgi:hypothetical protein